MRKLRTLGNKILFQFVEARSEFKRGAFEDKTDWGFDLGHNFDATAKLPRWGTVLAIGPDVKEEGIVVGANVFIEELKWTAAVTVDGESVWQTDEDCILGVQAS